MESSLLESGQLKDSLPKKTDKKLCVRVCVDESYAKHALVL